MQGALSPGVGFAGSPDLRIGNRARSLLKQKSLNPFGRGLLANGLRGLRVKLGTLYDVQIMAHRNRSHERKQR